LHNPISEQLVMADVLLVNASHAVQSNSYVGAKVAFILFTRMVGLEAVDFGGVALRRLGHAQRNQAVLLAAFEAALPFDQAAMGLLHG